MRRGPASHTPPRGRDLGARPCQTHRFRCVLAIQEGQPRARRGARRPQRDAPPRARRAHVVRRLHMNIGAHSLSPRPLAAAILGPRPFRSQQQRQPHGRIHSGPEPSRPAPSSSSSTPASIRGQTRSAPQEQQARVPANPPCPSRVCRVSRARSVLGCMEQDGGADGHVGARQLLPLRRLGGGRAARPARLRAPALLERRRRGEATGCLARVLCT